MALLRIELLQDCEMNSGRSVNSLFSDDVFFDGFGLPYIPAWIVRNSFARAIEKSELKLTKDDVEALVGWHAELILDDALVADRESMRQAILSDPYSEVLLRNPQNILNVSGHTKVKKNAGLSESTYVRLLTRGTIFEAYCEFGESLRHSFQKLVDHTDGLYVGYEVKARFTLDETWERPHIEYVPPLTDWDGEYVRLKYDLYLISRTTSLDHVSGELEAEPFITGKKIRAALASRSELADTFAQGAENIRCSYAYVDVHGRRGLPIPASYSTKKQDKSDLRDRCSRGRRPNDYDQIKGVGTLFIDDPDNTEVHAMGVRKEQAFVQYYMDGSFTSVPYRAIGQAQTCQGFIEGPRDDVKRIFDSLMADGHVRVGHLSNVGFGNAFLQVKSVASMHAPKPQLVEEATVLLASPARLYRGGMYEVSAENVLKEIQSRLGGDVELEVMKNSQKTCTVSIYNNAWRELEPLEYAMQAGSIYRIRAKDRSLFDIAPIEGGIFIGRHTDIGYGETWVMPAVDAYYRHIVYDDMPESDFPLSYKVDPNPGRRLIRTLYQSNANVFASHLGSMRGESFALEDFKEGPLRRMQSLISDNFDMEQAFEAYIDSIKKSGLNAIRRGQRD